jgi:hypothetical protein
MTIVRDLSARSVAAWPTVDLAHVSKEPASPIEPFEFHGCYCAAASFKGSPPLGAAHDRRRAALHSRWLVKSDGARTGGRDAAQPSGRRPRRRAQGMLA